MNQIKAVIVEDDPNYSAELELLVKQVDASVKIVAVATSIAEAVEAITKVRPQIVFLDICLNGNERAGFEVLQMVGKLTFDVIFTTAFVDENIGAIRMCGLAYIVKPYIGAELEEALQKFANKNGFESKILASFVDSYIASKFDDISI